jgi:cardiolipin synthase
MPYTFAYQHCQTGKAQITSTAMPELQSGCQSWLRTGDEVFSRMLAAIESAQSSVRLETYIYSPDDLGRRFRDALVQAGRRGVRVQVLVDAFGSSGLTPDFWGPLLAACGEARSFNPVLLKRLGFRDHRKIMVCDDATAFVGGFNISREYEGDGVTSGWCDLGLEVTGRLAVELAAAFDEMFARADLRHKPFTRLRRSAARRKVRVQDTQLLLSGPGRGFNPFKRFLHRDLRRARSVRMIAAYFLPTWQIRRDLMRLARSGARVQLILPAKSDVFLSQLAARSLYRRFLKAGIEIYEYQPQILHAKLVVIDEIGYAGSSNLDPRSLHINYELMLRFRGVPLVAGAHAVFDEMLPLCRRIEPEAWRESQTWWHRLRQRFASFLLVRVDPVVARWEYR